jgi:hypothetical protein
MGKLLINCTHGKEDPERATLSFVVGNVAASADQEVVVLLTIEGVRNATRGYADDIHKEGFQPLKEVMRRLSATAGRSGPGACTKPRASPMGHGEGARSLRPRRGRVPLRAACSA